MNDLGLMNRRSLMQRALVLAGASVALSACDALTGPTSTASKLTGEQLKLATAIADTIIPQTDTPGAVMAGVPKALDALYSDWASADRRKELAAAMEAIDRLGGTNGFASLPAEKRNALLARHDAAALKPAPQKQAPSGGIFSFGPPVTDPGYAKLKELIVVLFYLSESALTNDLEWEHDPGAWKPSVPITPETRAQGGVSPI
ncbi:gluconate 2-dehydrogenase subunit 3 family protein [Caenibius sp. WL]|uniref:gluconate 2-dehydrogenase subunit 3 family protein n=1 Tax=Caenibius sp. WL TaxID=2872646 RepID=UPI001C99CDDA|nr:gluconate 2-dehydrogenase subunit 3 family protein [Caenibius sp. WL]QZP07672.1 gluconate 2-dehydrogenase subunit 3 family protein [Caenibius sp. WL]